jgi:thiamine pyrophosphokinase
MTDTVDVSQPMILLVVGGDPAAPVRLPVPLASGSIVVAADSGLDRLSGAVVAHHVVGDLDSVSHDGLTSARAGGASVHEHPADKDATDLELALDLIVDILVPESGVDRLLVVGGGGGRLDHHLGDLLALSGPRLAGLEVTARFGPATVTIVRPGAERSLTGRPHEQVSLLPLHGPADGVTTTDLRWALVDAHLAAGTTRAMSNEFTGDTAAVRLSAGVLAAVQPGTTAPPITPRATAYDPTPRPPEGHPS